MSKRCAIVGTAPSWNKTPWDDPGMVIKTLNDGYTLGVPRLSEHYDLHPFDKMWFRPKWKTTFREGDIPEGVYVRPEGHLEWLQERAKTIPVWLQADPPHDWALNAKRFPFEDVAKWLKARPDQEAYIASSPVQMLAHAVLEGYTEIHIYGIHLATMGEYIDQRPNMEWAMAKAEGAGVNIVIPPECPLLKHSHVYGREPKPVRPDAAAMKRLHQAKQAYQKLATELVTWPRFKSKVAQLAQLSRLKAEIRDAQQQARHAVITQGAA